MSEKILKIVNDRISHLDYLVEKQRQTIKLNEGNLNCVAELNNLNDSISELRKIASKIVDIIQFN